MHLEKCGVVYPLLHECVGIIIVPITPVFVQQANQVKRQGEAMRKQNSYIRRIMAL